MSSEYWDVRGCYESRRLVCIENDIHGAGRGGAAW